jgi:hypothetical protein
VCAKILPFAIESAKRNLPIGLSIISGSRDPNATYRYFMWGLIAGIRKPITKKIPMVIPM